MSIFKECPDCDTYAVCAYHERCQKAASERAPSETAGPAKVVAAVATGSLPVSSVRALLAIWERREAGLRAAGKTDLADMMIVMADELRAEGVGSTGGSVFPTLATHRARQNRDGLSRWKIRTSKGERTIQLQAYKGRLYLYGQMIERERDGAPIILLRFEETLAGIARVFGSPYSPNADMSQRRT